MTNPSHCSNVNLLTSCRLFHAQSFFSKPHFWSSPAHQSNKASHWAEGAEGRLMWDESLNLCRMRCAGVPLTWTRWRYCSDHPVSSHQLRTAHGWVSSEALGSASQESPTCAVGPRSTSPQWLNAQVDFPALPFAGTEDQATPHPRSACCLPSRD